MNGSLGAAGRGRGAGMQYSAPAMQGNAGSVLAETLTQVSPQMAGHTGLNTAQTGAITKVCTCHLLYSIDCTCFSPYRCLGNTVDPFVGQN